MCGITPYDTTHIGHAATFVWVDVLARVLEHVGIEPQVVRNITDIDDELLREAAARGTSWQALATQQTFQFEDDMRKLRVQRPTFEPASRDYVTDVIFLARALLDRGAAYERDGSVFFRVGDRVDAWAASSGLSRDAALAVYDARGGRADDPAKDDPFDAAIWQTSAGLGQNRDASRSHPITMERRLMWKNCMEAFLAAFVDVCSASQWNALIARASVYGPKPPATGLSQIIFRDPMPGK